MVDSIAMLCVHSCPFDPPGHRDTGGMSVYVRELSRCLGRMGVKVDIFTRSKDPDVSTVVDHGENVRAVHLRAGPQRRINRYRLGPYLREFIEEFQGFASDRGRPYQVLHGHYWLSGLVAAHLSREIKVPMVQNFHSIGLLKNIALGKRFGKEGYDPVLRLEREKVVIKMTDRVVAESPAMKSEILRHFSVDPGKVEIIPGGVDVDLFRPMAKSEARSRLGWTGKVPILFVGRPDRIKGISSLIEAMNIVCKASDVRSKELLWAFVGGEGDTIRRIVSSCSPPNAEFAFIDALDQRKLPLYYSAAEVCVIPSYHESFGMVALEAAACGTPVVGSSVGGLPLIVEEGVNGALVPPGDSEALARGLVEILADDPLRREMAGNAQRSAEAFEWSKLAARLHGIYERLASEPRENWRERTSPEYSRRLSSMVMEA